MTTLTDRQWQILGAIQSLTSESGGPPSLQELADEIGVMSVIGVHSQIRNLEALGRVARVPGKSRSIRVIEGVESEAASSSRHFIGLSASERGYEMTGWIEQFDGTWKKEFSAELVGVVRRARFSTRGGDGSANAWEGELRFVGDVGVTLSYPESKQARLTDCCLRVEDTCQQVIAALRPLMAISE
jgi:hypothetical protein